MEKIIKNYLKKLYIPAASSHKGDNGKLMIIGGSHLFHAASRWSLQISSRIVDMVFYSSVPENNLLIQQAKKEFNNGIVVSRDSIESYISEADCVLIGPGMIRSSDVKLNDIKKDYKSISQINNIKDEGLQTYFLTRYLLKKYSDKKWVIDAGALQMLDPNDIKKLSQVIITPHIREFKNLFGKIKSTTNKISQVAGKYGCVVFLKGVVDIICNSSLCVEVKGGNAGMTKGGTGDVLAGLTAALFCKNDALTSSVAASFFNKKAGESLYKTMGLFFNASDLCDELPKIIKEILL